ncbi:MAG TPA: nucleotidyltransferase domain-containing protein [Rhizomicrobium sp.]|jgi:predicted nucleotidyltransferase|nr:nucleotidyltransferase domain-containing protein [Rhizomicrobium sp.]
MGELANRREQTKTRLVEIRSRLEKSDGIASGKACVYVTGSFGRGEASPFSDLDLFIVGKNSRGKEPSGRKLSLLKRLDELRIKAQLVEVTRELKIPEFSGDGRYLAHYSVHDFTKTLGTPDDDAANTFTARLLLLLESKALVGDVVYKDVIQEVIDAYWRDYRDHKSNFMPAFLANDILRLWRTFCVNYEARTQRIPERKKAKGKITNYKLKHSRLLTCYSALLYLLAIYRKNNSVSPSDALYMSSLTPTERLEWFADSTRSRNAKRTTRQLISQYERFLAATNAPENELINQFLNKRTSQQYMSAAYKFGDSMFKVLALVGDDNRFYRLLVV